MAEGKDNTVWIVIAVVAALIVLGPLLMGGVMGTTWGWTGLWFLMPLMMIVPVGLIALLVFVVVRAASPQSPAGQSPEDARRVLDLRLARGEITEEEHDRLLERIR